MHLVLGDVEAEFIRFAVGDPPLDAAASQPHREGVRVVVAALGAAEHGAGLHHRRAAKFTPPDDERAVEHPPPLKIGHERGAPPVRRFAVLLHVAFDV